MKAQHVWRARTMLIVAVAAILPISCTDARCQAEGDKSHDSSYKYTNRLAKEKSPYLLQHAHNPVNWYPWGEEAFQKARDEGKLIFLSVGYSTCHWCHVMEHESFENEEIAKMLNDNFVAIKVDREERPDVDGVYMTFVQAMTGSGGWPMSVWLTPDLHPIYGGTYFPPNDAGGRVGFKTILLKIANAWKNDRDQIIASSSDATRQLQLHVATGEPTTLAMERSLLDSAFQGMMRSYEPRYGGFGAAPKFPRPVVYNFLLRYYARTKEPAALEMTLHTLRKMADGGMHDHIGGGFHRYSTDDRWHVPHFEKMLYDQAQLATSYLEAYQITHAPEFAATARDVLDYVLREMTAKEGTFFSAEDADSPIPGNPTHHAEGAFYVWEEGEIERAIGGDAASIFNYYYGVEKGGNVTSDPFGEFPKKNVLIVTHTLAETAQKFKRSADAIVRLLADARRTLFQIRAKRPRPHLDDKTIVAWNGLMISAMARGYQVLDDKRYLDAAVGAASFIGGNLYNRRSKHLLRRYRQGDAAIDGYADDYAFLIQGLLDLYEASFDVSYLLRAIDLQKMQNEIFGDRTDGGYYNTAGNDPHILLRMKESYDGAEPSANSIATLNLLRLAEMTDNVEFRTMAEKTLAAFGTNLQRSPGAMPQMLVAFDYHLDKPKQIVIAGAHGAADTHAMLRAIYNAFIPVKIVMLADGGNGQRTLAKHLEFIETVTMLNNRATAYVCQNYVCKLPTNSISEMMKTLTQSSDPHN